MDDHAKLIEAMKAFCAPEAQEKRLREKWAAATKIHTLHIQLSSPAPDGDFEILFVTDKEVENRKKLFSKSDRVDEISFAAGVALAKTKDCCGGAYTIEEARIIAQVHNDARADNARYDLGL